MSSFLIGATIHDQATADRLPIDAVVIADGGAWQRGESSDWYAAGSDIDETSAHLLERGPLLLVWLPPENGAPQ